MELAGIMQCGGVYCIYLHKKKKEHFLVHLKNGGVGIAL
jgi:hypothetical protein